MLKIAELLNVEPQPLDGEAQEITPARMVAVIDENNCIGCTKCIQACPVDAIVGATRAMHTVMVISVRAAIYVLIRARRTASRCNRSQKHLTHGNGI